MRKFYFFLLLIGSSTVFAQAVFEPSTSSVYDFLSRLSIKGIIEFNDELKPLSRTELSKKIIAAKDNKNLLTSLELEELEYFKKEFAPELEVQKENLIQEGTQFFKIDDVTGFRFFLFKSNNFIFNLDPILGLGVTRRFNMNQTHRWNGLKFYGCFEDNWGFNFYFQDNEEWGQRIDRTRAFSPKPGFNLSQKDINSIQYSDVQGLISYSWNSGNISVGRENIEWGSGLGGKLILSDKAPPFPFIKFEFSPVDWLKFIYFHGWLHSALLDSSTIRKTLVDDRDSYSQRDKFIAAHIVSIYPLSNFSISLGESMIYSDKLEFAYFVPVLFFRSVDHYISKDSVNSGDNAQLFFNAVYKYSQFRTKLYATLFIDELSINKVLEGTNLSSIGFTCGVNIVDPFLDNSELSFEYTRLNPFVYMNSNDAQLYTSHNYQLGHWIGSNADQFYAEYNQGLLRGLKLKIWGEHVRKGQKELPKEQYVLPYPEFLYGDKLLMTNVGIVFNYEILHSLVGELTYTFSNISDENSERTPGYQLGKKNSFGISFGYGF